MNCCSYKHKTEDCKGPNRRNCVYNCGAEGHKANTCKEKPFCPLSSDKRHGRDKTGCKRYRRAVNQARKKKIQMKKIEIVKVNLRSSKRVHNEANLNANEEQ